MNYVIIDKALLVIFGIFVLLYGYGVLPYKKKTGKKPVHGKVLKILGFALIIAGILQIWLS